MSGRDLAAGLDTIRVPHAPTTDQQRATRDAKALANLKAWGALDIADMLGLVPPAGRKPRAPAQVTRREALPDRRCVVCQTMFTPWTKHSKACSRACGGALGNQTRKARAQARAAR